MTGDAGGRAARHRVGLAVLAGARSWAAAAPALMAMTVGQGLTQTTMTTVVAGRAEPGRRGLVLGARQSAGGLARVAGPALGGVPCLGARRRGIPYLVGAGLMLAAPPDCCDFCHMDCWHISAPS